MAPDNAQPLPGQLKLFDDPPAYKQGFRAGLEAAARSLDPKTRGESERPPSGQPFHKWYAAKQVRQLMPEEGPISGVFPVGDLNRFANEPEPEQAQLELVTHTGRPTVPEPAQTGPELISTDYTVQALSDHVAYLERELAGLEANYQENLRIALTEAADHITRQAADMMEEESQKLIVRPRSNEDMLDHLMVQVRGLALIFDEAG